MAYQMRLRRDIDIVFSRKTRSGGLNKTNNQRQKYLKCERQLN